MILLELFYHVYADKTRRRRKRRWNVEHSDCNAYCVCTLYYRARKSTTTILTSIDDDNDNNIHHKNRNGKLSRENNHRLT